MNLRKNTQRLLMGVIGLGLTVPACAETFGPYVTIMGGLNWVAPHDLNQNNVNFVEVELDESLHSGLASGLAVGWRFPVGLRPELELSYRKNALVRFNNRVYDGGGSIDAKGEERASSLMANLWYEGFNLPASFSRFSPYIGGGVGYIDLSVSGLKAGGVSFGGTHRDTVMAYQLGAGFGYELSQQWAMLLEYRYLKTRTAHFGDIQGLPPGDVSMTYGAQSLMLGLRYGF
ncbi:Outer membrane protein beta-barrel domain-containing protein [Pseudomonas gessardii]|uniref:Porin family protein n=1 Tax=Pseudomonas gessardii TaxID=78544 RepID=A0A7Y1MR49_9PSED|nr:outer membrane beta-barrel protein [Pseudomonas gessardii]MRU49091.1 porin family protein [Pseudomonas gessardii]NNA96845.1 porin family protein [Pseudomonas gessardii]ONH49468.1 autotransporter outer membrane beta-barrel domain-containing protein [Pseudomonas gessardii]SDQ49468.1 Outer membrane protein beta-barrel domain-containing protein [Pseudomonas gessardii]